VSEAKELEAAQEDLNIEWEEIKTER